MLLLFIRVRKPGQMCRLASVPAILLEIKIILVFGLLGLSFLLFDGKYF